MVAGKLSHLVGHAAVGVFVGDRQHLIGLQAASQRDISQGGVDRIFRTAKQAGIGQFLVVVASHQSCTVQDACHLVDVAGGRIGLRKGAVLCVGIVRRDGTGAWSPQVGAAYFPVLAEVGQCYDVAGVAGCSCLVCHPYFHTVDGYACLEVRQRFHRRVIVVAEVLGEEEVVVLLIIGSVDLERCKLSAAP